MKLNPWMDSGFRRGPGTGAETTKAFLFPALSLQILLVASAAVIGSSAQAAPRSQSLFATPVADRESGEVSMAVVSTAYLRTVGPAPMRLAAPVVSERAPRPSFPEAEEMARDPDAYRAAQVERRATGGTPPARESADRDIRISVGGDPLPEISVSPYSSPRVHPEDVILFFKDDRLDGLRGGVAYPAARLRFDPAQPDVRTSSSATFTRQ